MSDQFPRRTPKPNPITRDKHRREVFLQITLPIILFLLVIMTVAVLAAWTGLSGEGDASRWADISLIFLIIPLMGITLLFTLFLVGLVFVVMQMIGIIPPYARQLQDTISRLGDYVERAADLSIEPILRIEEALAMLKKLVGRG